MKCMKKKNPSVIPIKPAAPSSAIESEQFDASDFMTDLQELALAQRLKRLSDQLNQGQLLMYQMEKISFEPAWFPIFYLLHQKQKLSIVDIAEHLQITHSAVSQLVTELVKKKYLMIEVDDTDKRKRLVTLTKQGLEMTEKLLPVWQNVKTVLRELMISTGYDVLDVIGKLEKSLEDVPLSSRLYDQKLAQQNAKTQIIGYQPKYKADFERLNRQWLEKYFTVEAIDELYFANPEQEIIARGGHIFFALYEGAVVGTCALIPDANDDSIFEFAKMAIDDAMQGRYIGELLLTTAIDVAKSDGKRSLYLEMNSEFVRSVQLYRKHGFTLAPFEGAPKYQRSDSILKLRLR